MAVEKLTDGDFVLDAARTHEGSDDKSVEVFSDTPPCAENMMTLSQMLDVVDMLHRYFGWHEDCEGGPDMPPCCMKEATMNMSKGSPTLHPTRTTC